ncbi:MAG TPA: ATP-binding protein [candidate division Zixibacteria bacterium]|nr:ATP-binding protein [candidate division Zixibacteria bacterium]
MVRMLLQTENYAANLQALPVFLTAIAAAALGLVIAAVEKRQAAVPFLAMTLAVAVWLLSYALAYCARVESVAVAWASVGQAGVTAIPAAFYHFTASVLGVHEKRKRSIGLCWLLSGLFLCTVAWTNGFVAGVYLYSWGYYVRYGWIGAAFLLYFFAAIAWSLQAYRLGFRTAGSSTGKLRSKALFTAFCVGYLGAVDYLPAFGVPLYPVGFLPVLASIVLAARAVRRYRLIDVTPAFAAEQVINAMADALLILDHEGIVRVANPAACRLFERQQNRLIGSPVGELGSRWAGACPDLERRILAGSLREVELALPAAANGVTHVSVSSFPMIGEDHRPVAFICIFRDISQQRKSQEELRRHAERQAALYEINRAITSTLELEAVLNLLLDRLERLLPHTAVTVMLLGKQGEDLSKVGCRGIAPDAWKIEERARGQHPVLSRKEVLFVPDIRQSGLPDCDVFARNGFVSCLGVPLMAKDAVFGVLSFYRREPGEFSEEELYFLRNVAAQTAVAIDNSQLYEQARRQAVDLERANRVKDEFLSVMSHELRTPLNVISGYAKLVEDGMLGEVNPEQVNALEKVSRHASELLVMVNSIMDATKIEAGAVVVECEDFSLSEFLQDLAYLYDYPLPKNLSLEWNYQPDLPRIRSDRGKLKHVMQNLINNALKFTEAGRVVVSARRTAEDRVELEVSDTGIGIAPADLPSIFDKFRQVDSSRTRSQGGVGLGLHIVKTFVQMLGGTIRVESQLGKGSTFTITLPCVYSGSAPSRYHAAPPGRTL